MSERNKIINNLLAHLTAEGPGLADAPWSRSEFAEWLMSKKTPEPKPGELWQVKAPGGHVLGCAGFVTNDGYVVHRTGARTALNLVTPLRRLFPRERSGDVDG